MAYKCIICGSNEVEQMGGICELCAISQDPYASAMQGNTGKSSNVNLQTGNDIANTYLTSKGKSRKVLINGGASLNNVDPYGNDMTVYEPEGQQVQVYQPGQAPIVQTNITQTNAVDSKTTVTMKGNQPITLGITKNIMVDCQKKSFLEKWFRSLFSGIPFTLDDEITMFQVFPDFTGTSLNAMGNACDQVIVYGKLNAGVVSENNDVEVYGHRDSNNNIIAKTIKNRASGTTIIPDRIIPVWLIWVITILLFCILLGVVATLGIEGIVLAFVLLVCLMNLPTILKILGVIFGLFFLIFKRK